MPERFVAALCRYKSSDVFNPWNQRDKANDAGADGAVIRRRHLLCYLKERIGVADVLLCAEAIGYQGGHFTGIPMTSERLLLGGLVRKGLKPDMVFSEIEAQRTSREALRRDGFTEPTATIVWGVFVDLGLDPRRVVLWNAFPWHPYHADKGLLSNRTPSVQELEIGRDVLRQLLDLGAFRRIVAVGEKAFLQLTQMGVPVDKVRHPANGGAGKFRRQMQELL